MKKTIVGINWIMVLVFLLVIFMPMKQSLSRVYWNYKKNFLSPKNTSINPIVLHPDKKITLRSFPIQFDDFFSKNFGYRNALLKIANNIKYILKDFSAEGILIGKQGWLFLDKNDIINPVDTYRGAFAYDPEVLSSYVETINQKNQWLSERGVPYFFVIAPNKHSIYPEYLPDYIRKTRQGTSTDDLINHLLSQTEVQVIDLRIPLRTEKKDEFLYFPLGPHWNIKGANIAQKYMMDSISKVFPGKIQPEQLEDDRFYLVHEASGDRRLAKNMGQNQLSQTYPKFIASKDQKHSLVDDVITHLLESENDQAELEALIFRDSFGIAMIPFLNNYFKKVVYIWEVARLECLELYFDKYGKPDLVIEVTLERLLYPDQFPELSPCETFKP